MSNIAKIDRSIAVASQFRGNSIEKRIAMVNVPEVQNALTHIEKSIFLATTKIQIRDISKEKLFSDLKKMLIFLIKDLGIRAELDSYDYARFFDIVSRYFSELSFPEIKIAFEMSMIGELDNYLPKNGNREPDRGHYQSFSFEYITKILTAYRKRRNFMLKKAYESIPIQAPVVSEKVKLDYRKIMLLNLRGIALRYKYSGLLEFRGVEGKLMYDILVKNGYADEIITGESDKSRAMAELINSTLIKQVHKHSINKKRLEHNDVIFRGYIIARDKEIVRVLDLCNKYEIQIKEYIR